MRLNIGERIISIRVFNGTAAPVSITAAKLATPLFDGTAFWTPGPSGSSILRPGATVALPVPLTVANCAQPAADPKVFLTLDGAEHQFAATDPHAVLSSLQHQDCLGQSVREVAELRLLRELDVAPDRRTAVVRLSVLPSGNGGNLELNSIRGTTLLAEDPDRPWPRELSIAGTDSASVVEVSVLPARCDPHALAEDKAGTWLPVDITAGEWSGQLLLEPDEEFTRSVYAFVTAACAKEGSTESAGRRK